MGQHGGKHEEIYAQVLRAGRRTYFFDVRSTRAGDYYLTITESKKFTNDDGSFYYKKHKIYLYKEDFDGFIENLKDVTDFIIDKKGREVISERHEPGYDKKQEAEEIADQKSENEEFTNLNFEDI